MAIPRLFKLPSYRQFDYQPLYYNADREEREMRNREIARELGLKEADNSTYTPGIQRGSMRNYIKSQKRSSRKSNLRLIIILFVLFLIAYLILYR